MGFSSILDTSIPRSVESPMNGLMKVMQLQGLQRENELGTMKLEEYQRGVGEGNALRRALGTQGFSWDNPEHRNAAVAASPTKAHELYKTHVETKSKESEGKKRDFDMAKEGYGLFNRRMGSWMNDPKLSKAGVVADIGMFGQLGALNPAYVERFAAALPDDPVALRDHLRRTVSAELPAEKMLEIFAPKPTEVSDGATKGFRDTNPNSPTYGQMTAGAPVVMQQTPSDKVSIENNQRTVGASYYNANATRAAAKTTAEATRDAARIQTGFQNEQGLRKEFEALPEVKKYKGALPAYKGIEDAVKRNTPQSDINIVYGIAKLYDPESVVREGEYATVANSPNIPERIKGYAQYLAGGGRLTDKVKADILAEAQGRMKSYETEYSAARTDFDSIATRTGVDATRVFPSAARPAVAPSAGGDANLSSAIDAELKRRAAAGKK